MSGTNGLTPDDELWIELAQMDDRFADRLWDGDRSPGPFGPADEPRWRPELVRLIETARGSAEPGELDAEPSVVPVMQFTRATLRQRSLAEVGSVAADALPGSSPAGDDRAGGRDHRELVAAGGRPRGGDSSHRGARFRPPRQGRGRVKLVGRMVVAKGVAAAGAVSFGVAAAAATTGIVATGIVVSLVEPKLADQAPATKPPAVGVTDDDIEGRSGASSEGPGSDRHGFDPGAPVDTSGAPTPAGSPATPNGATGSTRSGSGSTTGSGSSATDADTEGEAGDASAGESAPVGDEASTATTVPGEEPVDRDPATPPMSGPPPECTTTTVPATDPPEPPCPPEGSTRDVPDPDPGTFGALDAPHDTAGTGPATDPDGRSPETESTSL